MYDSKILNMNLFLMETFGYLFIFFAIFLEGLPFIGAFIPGGSIIIFFTGFFSKLGYLNLWVAMLVCFLASVLVDTLGYFLGRCFDRKFLHIIGKKILIRRHVMKKISKLIEGHTGKALIFGRLNPATRSIAPFLVGSHNVKFSKFIFFNIIGGILWVSLFAFLGYVFGSSYQIAEECEKYIIITTILLIVGFYIYYLITYFKDKNSEIKKR